VIISADNLEANYRENKLYIKEGKKREVRRVKFIEGRKHRKGKGVEV
jgi:16S rRNA U516 pseudouridylate synthase RsuA-like enzyme